MSTVVIVQEYIPEYRVPFFRALSERALDENIHVVVAAGTSSTAQASRNDAALLERVRFVNQSERQFLGRRLTVRDIRPAISDADFIIMEQARRNLDAYRLLAAPRRLRQTPIGLWGHGRDYVHAPSSGSRAALNWLTRRADWFFAYTDGGARAVNQIGFPLDRITTVENAIDTRTLATDIQHAEQVEVHEFEKILDLRGKTAIFVGGLDRDKRITFLLEGARIAAGQDPDFRLIVAGEGDEAPYVRDMARRTTWLRYIGPVVGRAKATALAASQVIAMPGRVGLVAVDSFAAGTPIVTTGWPFHAPEFEYLTDGHNAVVSGDSPSEYATALTATLRDREQLSRLREGALSDAHRYNVEAMASRYLRGIMQWRQQPRGRRV